VVFALIGMASTFGYGLLFVLLRGHLGAQPANAAALAITAVANTAANRRFTFGFQGRTNALRHQVQGLLVFGAGLGITSASLVALHHISGRHHPLQEVAVLTAANLLVTLMRFVAMRVWIFRGRKN
jgi:putative flippase GtrA